MKAISKIQSWEGLRGVVVNILNDNIFVSLNYKVHFWTNTFGKGMNPLIPLLFFSKDGFSIKLSGKVDMPLNKETKPNQNM